MISALLDQVPRQVGQKDGRASGQSSGIYDSRQCGPSIGRFFPTDLSSISARRERRFRDRCLRLEGISVWVSGDLGCAR